MTKPIISVVILNWNGKEMMERFLPSVVQYSTEAQIVVADNGSTDSSIQMLREKFPSVRILAFDQNYGFAEGYNMALKEIDTPYTLLLNSDVEVTDQWLVPLLYYMEEHPDIAACQPKIKAERQRDFFEYAGACGGFIDFLGYPFCRGRVMNIVERDEQQYEDIVPIFWATGAALLVRTDVYKAVGGLDGRFFAHMEEIDFCWRLRSRGFGIVCIPQSTVYHVGGATLSKSNPKKTFLNFRNNLLMLYKNTPEANLSRVMRWRTLLDYVAAFKMLLGGQFGEFKAVLKARKEFARIKSDFTANRNENMEKTKQAIIPEMKQESLLWNFYCKGKKKYSSLIS